MGYADDISRHNPRFEYVPERWVDIGREFMRTHYQLTPAPEGYGDG